MIRDGSLKQALTLSGSACITREIVLVIDVSLKNNGAQALRQFSYGSSLPLNANDKQPGFL
jgi:hypothetical protein